jgi:hypothetical protein
MSSSKRVKMIFELEDYKIPVPILEYVAQKTRSPIEVKGSFRKIYESMNDEALELLYRVFVKREVDRAGRFLELRLADFIMKKHKDISKVDFRKKLVGASKAIHEIDVVGYNEKEDVKVIGECKTRASTKDHITKWFKEVEDLLRGDYGETLGYAYFMSLGGYTEDAIKMIKDAIDKDGKYKLGLFGPYVYLYFLEEREGKVYKVLPK